MGDEAPVSKPKAPTLPFKPQEFDWSSPNLYLQFKLFRTKCNYTFKGAYCGNTKEAKVGAILNWLRTMPMKYIPISIGLLPLTRMTLIRS